MSKNIPEIDISVVTYNSLKWIERFFYSLENQNYPLENINLYFTDNGSQDNTVSVLERIRESSSLKYKSFNIFKEDNRGFGAGHNNNIFMGKSKFVLVTNIDLEFENDTLSSLLTYVVEDCEKTGSWELRQKPYEHPKDYNPINLHTNWSSSACILFSRKALEEIKGYDERIFMYGEDVDISYRLRDAGYILKYYPKASVWHYSYEYENQIKPLQFFGNTISNVWLRFRFGNIYDILKGIILYFALLFFPQRFEGQRIGVIKNIIPMLFKLPGFVFRRKKSNIKFKFYLWDYEKVRDGAFYKYENTKHCDLVSVIIRTCNNRREMLKEAVQSILNQTYENIELIVVEDGSNYAEQYILNEIKDSINYVKYISIPKSGRCVAGNVGLANSSGTYCVFLDDDDAFYPEHVEVLISEIYKHNVLAVYSNAYEVRTKYISYAPLNYEEKERDVIYKQPFSRVLMWHQNYIPIQCILFSRKLYEEYGGFDKDLNNLEDWNLWTRYSLNHDFVYVEKTTSMYRTPCDTEISKQRQKELDSYYNKALEKQKDLALNISVYEFNEYQEKLKIDSELFSISKIFVKNVLIKHKFLGVFYTLFRKIYYKYKNNRG